jgi:hypothetical protein
MCDADKLRSEIAEFLARHTALTLAYADGGEVAACGLWFASDEALNCYFLSSANTRHGRALAKGGQVSFAIHKDEQDWRVIQGVQGRGWCAPLSDAQAQSAWQVYARRFPFVLQQFPDIESALKAALLWRITPSWLRLIDNAKGFGHKQEIHLGDTE